MFALLAVRRHHGGGDRQTVALAPSAGHLVDEVAVVPNGRAQSPRRQVAIVGHGPAPAKRLENCPVGFASLVVDQVVDRQKVCHLTDPCYLVTEIYSVPQP